MSATGNLPLPSLVQSQANRAVGQPTGPLCVVTRIPQYQIAELGPAPPCGYFSDEHMITWIQGYI